MEKSQKSFVCFKKNIELPCVHSFSRYYSSGIHTQNYYKQSKNSKTDQVTYTKAAPLNGNIRPYVNFDKIQKLKGDG
ncbi:unnamed protein product [Acanthoscelides obtectus]|uniref:Uncharacterized protein n=1 Tax=Acanthoscelides obtectus TaxID=200917 RepID=A0A9P0JLT6_ACAOB|nr:unnamed protein product [Acanthoscelides obtectus]CAK1642860.1 hypothetical protein AOBTE_LOCUS13247 [Acanthoscelides obtectus]